MADQEPGAGSDGENGSETKLSTTERIVGSKGSPLELLCVLWTVVWINVMVDCTSHTGVGGL